MFSFNNDYAEGACSEILQNLINTNFLQSEGYGLDEYCLEAQEIIRKLTNHEDVDVHFITGGTPCNVLAASTLRSYEAIICAENGHINVHETGAIEATGHKIIAVKPTDGKISVQAIKEVLDKHCDEHMVKPKMVFISNPSELGTIYSKEELTNISNICKENDLYLYLDGARLGCGLTAKDNDLTLQDITDLTDLYYIGGTKNGALLGEAMVIKNEELKKDFRFLIKQHCSMLAKGRIIGIEFKTLLENDLYYQLADNANKMAQQLNEYFKAKGVTMLVESKTNQIFPILPNFLINELRKEYIFQDWQKMDENFTAVRFVCSWATRQENIDDFIQYCEEIIANLNK